jgi:hypothetical protein
VHRRVDQDRQNHRRKSELSDKPTYGRGFWVFLEDHQQPLFALIKTPSAGSSHPDPQERLE